MSVQAFRYRLGRDQLHPNDLRYMPAWELFLQQSEVDVVPSKRELAELAEREKRNGTPAGSGDGMPGEGGSGPDRPERA